MCGGPSWRRAEKRFARSQAPRTNSAYETTSSPKRMAGRESPCLSRTTSRKVFIDLLEPVRYGAPQAAAAPAG